MDILILGIALIGCILLERFFIYFKSSEFPAYSSLSFCSVFPNSFFPEMSISGVFQIRGISKII